ncbi:MAG: Imidazole glycerol phosphate synthase subunit HisH [Promethearchaeota archaeon]|jgi:glutamine amidotransferase|nr:MAG: Imidazole glycerol phosphate synthase subunit HisH [Candidatus Lokiarchaeota archaeon]
MSFYIAIIDYGMGNLKSVSKLLDFLKISNTITSDPEYILNADGVILPGVGAFGDAMENLRDKGLVSIIDEIVREGKPLFGICLGLQLLFTKSYEMGEFLGLGYIPGEVIPFDKSKVGKIPQIGWNSVNLKKKDHYLINNIPNNSYFYFVHSFYCVPENEGAILGQTQYGEITFCSIARKENIVATQFHPEKSSTLGIQMYKNFVEFCKK